MKLYRKKQLQQMRPYIQGENLEPFVSISAADLAKGSPKEGDMIAVNPNNPKDKWLVEKQFFLDNYEEVK